MTSDGALLPTDPVSDRRGPLARIGMLNRNGWRLTTELARIALGSSPVTPASDDWRFRDLAWAEHPFYRRLGQAYTASCAFADETLDGLASTGRSSSAAQFLLNVFESPLLAGMRSMAAGSTKMPNSTICRSAFFPRRGDCFQ